MIVTGQMLPDFIRNHADTTALDRTIVLKQPI
jgi:hypothetical protein